MCHNCLSDSGRRLSPSSRPPLQLPRNDMEADSCKKNSNAILFWFSVRKKTQQKQLRWIYKTLEYGPKTTRQKRIDGTNWTHQFSLGWRYFGVCFVHSSSFVLILAAGLVIEKKKFLHIHLMGVKTICSPFCRRFSLLVQRKKRKERRKKHNK